jgi:hypothetical protein
VRKLLAVLALGVAACAGPATTVRTVDTRPALAVAGAPSGSVLVVDGIAIGDASTYDGRPNVLRVEPGTHEVEIRTGQQIVFRERVFVESELKTVKVH